MATASSLTMSGSPAASSRKICQRVSSPMAWRTVRRDSVGAGVAAAAVVEGAALMIRRVAGRRDAGKEETGGCSEECGGRYEERCRRSEEAEYSLEEKM